MTGTSAKKKLRDSSLSFLLWCHQESNRGHKDFQSFALPTELWHHRLSGCKGNTFFLNCKFFRQKNYFLHHITTPMPFLPSIFAVKGTWQRTCLMYLVSLITGNDSKKSMLHTSRSSAPSTVK